MSRGGMLDSALRARPRRSSDGTGDAPLKIEPVSDLRLGVPMTVVASPKSESISSNRTPQVSGYKKYTIYC